MLRAAIALIVLLLVPTLAHAEKRVALVIGNGAYANVGRLPNPASDAKAMEALFRAAGFDMISARQDLGVGDMRRALRDFSDQVRDADIAVVFYAGHGIEVNGTNHLIPVDAVLERDVDVEDETVSLDRVTQIIEPAKRLRLVILDACRDNPFLRSMQRTISGRSIGRGLAKVDVLTSDTLIAFAAKAGSTASDGNGANSPYTTALMKHLTTPGLDLRLALGRVRDDVLKTTGNRQEPFLYGSLGGSEISLVSGKALPAGASTAPQLSEAERAWRWVKDTASQAALENFIKEFGDTSVGALARARLEEMRKSQTAGIAPPLDTPKITPRPASNAQSAWVKLCEKGSPSLPINKDRDGKEVQKGLNVCLTHHERVDGNTGAVMVSAAVRQIEGQEKQAFMVMVPLGMQQQPGLRVSIYSKDTWEKAQKNEKIDESKLKGIALKYTLCHAVGCTAESEATSELINDLKTSGGLVAFAINAGGQTISFPIPLIGFEQAYAGNPVDNKQYAEARKALMEQIAQRQRELAEQQRKAAASKK